MLALWLPIDMRTQSRTRGRLRKVRPSRGDIRQTRRALVAVFSVPSLYAQLLSTCIGRRIANRKQRLHRYPPGRRLMNSTKGISGGLHERAMFGPPLTGGSPVEIKRDRRVMPPSDPSYAAHETPPWAMLLRHGQKKFPAARRRAFSASQASSRSRRSSSAFALNFAYSSALKFLSIASNRRASIPGQ